MGTDLFSSCLPPGARRVWHVLCDPIDDHIANLVIAELLFLEREDPDSDIELYINSPGGSVSAGLAMYDTMQLIKSDVATFCVGMAASMGAIRRRI